MPYPQPPKDKQYGAWFPELGTRSVPSPSGVKSVENAPLALHVEGSKSSETLGPPKQLDMGVLRLWLTGGPRRSRSFDDGPSFDFSKHAITKATEDGEDGFNFAPGTDEAQLKINWEVFGLPNIKSAKLELFGRGMFKPIWEQHWGDAWGKKKGEVGEFASKAKKTGATHTGELAFTEVKVDTGAKAKDEGDQDVVAFPKGLLTVARSPYQLRLTVSGCTADKTPADGDTYVYPMTAWTYLHVLVHSFDYRFGDPDWLENPRHDVAEKHRELICGKASGEVGLEDKIIEELRAFVKGESGLESMSAETPHLVPLLANHIKSWGDNEYELFEELWGKGTRIPIVARAKVKTLAHAATEKSAADVMAGARLLWDWGEPDPKRPTSLAGATPTLNGGKLTEQFLTKVSKVASEKYFPRGSFNCPKELGGKYGDDGEPVFLPQPTKGSGKGSPPYVVKPCAKRTWAVWSVFDEKGESGVIFWPSRFPGDSYRIRTYLWEEGLDKKEEIRDEPTAVGSPGVFTVYRRVSVHHIVVGDLPGTSVKAIRDATIMAARKQAYLMLDFGATEGLYTGQAYAPFMAEAVKNLVTSTSFANKYYYHGLELPYLFKLGASPGAAFMALEDQTTLKASVDRLFTQGAIRAVKKLDFITPELGNSDTVKGAKNGSTGCVIDIRGTLGPGEICYALSEPGKKPFEAESVTGVYSGKTWTLTLAGDLKSCWEVEVTKKNTKDHDKSVLVKFPGNVTTTLEFKRSALERNVASELSSKMKTDLKADFKRAVDAFADGQKLAIVIEGHEGTSSSSKRRMAAVEAELATLATTGVIQRKLVHQRFKDEASLASDSSFYAMGPTGFGLAVTEQKNLFAYVRDAMAFTHAKQKTLKEGLLVVQASRVSNLTDFTDQAYLKDSGKNLPFTDYPCGGAVAKAPDSTSRKVGLDDPAYSKLGMIFAITPDPAGAHYYAKPGSGKTPKKLWAILLHEVGHGLFLEHAKATRTGQLGASSPRPSEHTKDDPCIMSYDADTDQFCGLCMVRLRGWRWKDLAENTAYFRGKVTIGLGDLDSIFADAATTDEGKQARLQVLGLLNRPLNLATDPYFQEEFQGAWTYSWNLAKARLGSVLDTDPKKTLADAMTGFLVEDGKLPADDGQARLRVFGHYHPYYANMDLALRYGDLTVKGVRENQFRIGAIVGDIAAMFYGANPALGVYPLEIRLVDDQGAAMPDTTVWVKLLPPGPLKPFAEGPGVKVLGSTTFVTGTAGAPVAGTPQLNQVGKWLTDKVKSHDPSDGSDPQKDNAHFEMGGKRKMIAGGNVGKGVGGIRNVFTALGSGSTGPDLTQPVDSSGQKVPHAVELKTDSSGIARFLFTPSVVGGDAYKLSVIVPNPTDSSDIIARVDTGTLVLWRTYRIGAYYRMETVANDSELPASFKEEFRGRTVRDADEVVYRPLAPLNLKKTLGTELARAYGEVFFDDAAVTPKPIDAQFWTDFNKHADAFNAKWSSELDEIYFHQVLTLVPLTPDPGSRKIFRGRIQNPMPGHVAIVRPRAADFAIDVKSSIAHCDQTAVDGVTTVKLVALKANDSIFGFANGPGKDKALLTKITDKFEAAADGPALLDGSQVSYATGDVTVLLAADLPIPDFAWGNPNSDFWGPLISITGASLANTNHARLFALQRLEKKGWSVFIYKHRRMQPQDLVAAARGLKAGAQKVKVKQENHSGLALVLDFGTAPKEGMIHPFWANVTTVYAGYVPRQAVDPKAVMAPLTRSPYLMNNRAAAEYNQNKRGGYPDAPEPIDSSITWFEHLAGSKADYGLAETTWMRSLAGAALDQGFCGYPGQLVVQANYVSNIQGFGLGGKGAGNTAFIFNNGDTGADVLHYLVLHEVGHCLYGPHAPTEANPQKWYHDLDTKTHQCIMGKRPDMVSQLQTFCGKCNAGLRGLLHMEKPLWPDGEQGDPGAPKPGQSSVARRPVLADVTGGLQPPTPFVHMDPPDPDPPKEDAPLQGQLPPIPVDDQEEECAIDFIAQEKSNWCWAASSLIVRKFFAQEAITQCKLASDALGGGVDCCQGGNEDRCNVQHALVLVGLNVTQSGEGTALTWEQIKDEIDNDRPFIVASGHHYHVCYGYAEKAGQVLLVWDPLPVGNGMKKRMTYLEYKALIETEVTTSDGKRGHGANYHNLSKK